MAGSKVRWACGRGAEPGRRSRREEGDGEVGGVRRLGDAEAGLGEGLGEVLRGEEIVRISAGDQDRSGMNGD